jgi:accessory gene regulator protein AgrB
MSAWNKPIKELNTVVMAPIHKHNNNTVLLYSIRGELRISKYTPAVTIVAAWINADTGVGPSIAIGNQT